MNSRPFAASALAAAVALAAAGCANVQTTNRFGAPVGGKEVQPRDSIVVENSGFYLFGVVPLVSGSTENPGGSTLFNNTVTLENNLRLLEAEAAKKGPFVLDGLSSVEDSSSAWSIGIISRRTITTSACVYDAGKAASPPAP
jgi:hypothetical protein